MNKNTKTVIGILAHVDAGKTTLSEAILYLTESIRSLGRVDKGNTFLDTNDMEKRRGITIFSREATFSIGEREFVLLDTPGHADFSPEMERSLSVLDYALLLISAPDGVTAQVRVLWRLLNIYSIPTIIFVNKTDQFLGDKEALLSSIKAELSSSVVDFTQDMNSPETAEELAVCDEELLNAFLDGKKITDDDIRKLISERKLFPLFAGSALKMEKLDEFLSGLEKYTSMPVYPEKFAARVYKITHENSVRLTWIKMLGGSLSAKTVLEDVKDEKDSAEKVEQLRIYSGDKFTPVQEVFAGDIVALTGLTGTFAGQGLGECESDPVRVLQPIMTVRIILPSGSDPFNSYRSLKVLSEEDPSLNIVYEEETGEIDAQIMGQVQKEILHETILNRFGLDVSFGPTKIVYKETIDGSVEGVGHFEPLRHYAEVHLMLEGSGPGSGLSFEADCPTDILAKNWQRLVLTHLQERKHRGVLTGSPITDMKITLVSGKAHLKHTEGGDFRQATYRAVRQGLMMAKSVLLEPFLDFVMELPQENLGRALTDLDKMGAVFEQPDSVNGRAIIKGYAPAVTLSEYPEELMAYTRGEGQLSNSFKGFYPCHNADEVIEKTGYDPEADLRNPSSSVFCSHGSGTVIPWYEVRDYMHIGSEWESEEPVSAPVKPAVSYSEEDLMAIFERTYGPIKENRFNNNHERREVNFNKTKSPSKPYKGQKLPEKEYLLVDGYNIIYSWEDLKDLSKSDMKAARDKLMDILSGYAGFSKESVILVFDAYKVSGGVERIYKYHNIDIVFTAEAETADLYIEKTAHELKKNYAVTVATSDAVEQVIIYGAGAYRLSAKDLLERILQADRRIKEDYLDTQQSSKSFLGDVIGEDVRKMTEDA
ncbi:MAG: TetM/TetW/TetO/TetS family tetracycline resistance ribosomal protection protein [Lachnospiraceae bacterium]|nr:TetM/TetW/TetO/TetS family tetracycline resistance ribosomal protection protein [Lachnospiraceae bacterium]